MLARFRNEPALIYALIEVLIALGVAFGLNLTGEQVGAVTAVVAVLTGVGVRQAVYGPETVDRIVDAEVAVAVAERDEP